MKRKTFDVMICILALFTLIYYSLTIFYFNGEEAAGGPSLAPVQKPECGVEDRLQKIEKRIQTLDADINKIEKVMGRKLKSIDGRLKEGNYRMSEIEASIREVEAKVDSHHRGVTNK